MAADQVAGKTTAWVAAMFGVAVSPILGDWMFVLVGAVGGALVELSYMADPDEAKGWWRPLRRMAANTLSALLFTQLVAFWLLPEKLMAERTEVVLFGVAAAIAFGGRHVLPALVKRAKNKAEAP